LGSFLIKFLFIAVGLFVSMSIFAPDALDKTIDNFTGAIKDTGEKAVGNLINTTTNIINNSSEFVTINETMFLTIGGIPTEIPCESDDMCNVELSQCEEICVCSSEGLCLKPI